MLPSLFLILGLLLLMWGADNVVKTAPTIAERLRISPLAAGALILGVGTSLPELAVSVIAGATNEPLIAYGNAVGSNIANIGLIVGVAALISPLVFVGRVIRRQFLLMGLATTAFLLAALDTRLVLWEAFVLLFLLAASLIVIMRAQPPESSKGGSKGMKVYLILTAAILCVLVGARLAVHGASSLAVSLNVPPQLVSLSLLAIGTSLPELVVSISAAVKKQPQLVIGNVLGSNIFNLLMVVPAACLFHPIHITSVDLQRDGGFLLAFTLLLFILCFSWNKERKLGTLSGLLLLAYVLYIGLLGASAFGV